MENRDYEERIAKLEKDVERLRFKLFLEQRSRRLATRLSVDHRVWAEKMIWRLFQQVDPGYLSTMEQLRSVIGSKSDDSQGT